MNIPKSHSHEREWRCCCCCCCCCGWWALGLTEHWPPGLEDIPIVDWNLWTIYCARERGSNRIGMASRSVGWLAGWRRRCLEKLVHLNRSHRPTEASTRGGGVDDDDDVDDEWITATCTSFKRLAAVWTKLNRRLQGHRRQLRIHQWNRFTTTTM